MFKYSKRFALNDFPPPSVPKNAADAERFSKQALAKLKNTFAYIGPVVPIYGPTLSPKLLLTANMEPAKV